MELGVFSRTYEVGDLNETYRRMTAHGLHHTQFNLSNVGLPSLPETVEDTTLEQIRTLSRQYGVTLDLERDVLPLSQQRSYTTDLHIPHGDLESASQVRIFPHGT